MIRKIILENFMAHSRTELELEPGLTVLVGPNNSGKSAVVSALATLATNEGGGWMVRHDTRDCRVTVVITPDPADPLDAERHELIWQRKAGTDSYQIDGKSFSRLKRSTPDELGPLLRLDPVVIDKDVYQVHFSLQKQPIFLIDESPARAAAFFAAASDTSLLLEMQKRFRDRKRDTERRFQELEKREQQLEEQLAPLAPLPELATRLHDLEERQKQVAAGAARAERLRDLLARLKAGQRDRTRHRARLEVLKRCQPPPTLHNVVPARTLARRWREERTQAQRTRRRHEVLVALKPPPTLKPVVRLEQLHQQLRTVVTQRERLARRGQVLAALKSPPSLKPVVRLEQLHQQLRTVVIQRERLARRGQVLAALRSPPRLHDPVRLATLADELRRHQSQQRELAQARALLRKELVKLGSRWSAVATASWLERLRPPRPQDPALLPVVLEELERQAESARPIDPFLAVFIWGQLLIHFHDEVKGRPIGADLPDKLREALAACAVLLEKLDPGAHP
ncbi:MAG TPA: AAA family ATPase [Gemmatales bacterium]|nr:AAA family ATPase [Gemmatales bacterium]